MDRATEPDARSAPLPVRPFPGRLTIYHANGRATGTALRLELKLNRSRDDRYGCFFMEVARQKTAADRIPRARALG